MKTVRKINKPVKFFGLKSAHFGLFMLINAVIIIVSIFMHLHPIVIVCIISALLSVSGILLKNLSREHKAGNPDYLTGLSVKSITPTKIVDKRKVFNFIMKEK